MKKYKLINNTSKEETICNLVTIDGFDYYVGDSPITKEWKGIAYKKDVGNTITYNTITQEEKVNTLYPKSIFPHFYTENTWYKDAKKVIATNNPNIDISKVINLHTLASDSLHDFQKSIPISYTLNESNFYEGFKAGYNKAKETYQFTEEDIIEFGKFCEQLTYLHEGAEMQSSKELLDIWKEQQIKIIYYE